MNQTMQPKQSAEFTARVHGKHKSEDETNQAFPGVSASGWILRDNQKGREVERLIKTSEDATRIEWSARIRAIKGPLESAMVPAGSTIEILLEKTAAETLLRVLDAKMPKKDLDLWEEVRDVVRRKGLTVTARPYAKLEHDNGMDDLVEDCADAIEERRRAIAEEGEQ